MDLAEIISNSENGGNFLSSDNLRGTSDDFPPSENFKGNNGDYEYHPLRGYFKGIEQDDGKVFL